MDGWMEGWDLELGNFFFVGGSLSVMCAYELYRYISFESNVCTHQVSVRGFVSDISLIKLIALHKGAFYLNVLHFRITGKLVLEISRTLCVWIEEGRASMHTSKAFCVRYCSSCPLQPHLQT